MGKSYFFIVNPHSNSGRTQKNWHQSFLPEIEKNFKDFKWVFTQKKGDGAILAAQAKEQGSDVIVAVGGDGTINEVVNGLMTDNKKDHTPALACLPAGTGCDLIKSLGIARDFSKGLEVIKQDYRISSDVGLLRYQENHQEKIRYFINVAGCGASGEIVQQLNNSKKIFGSKLSFLLASLKNILKNKCSRVLISFDDEPAFEVELRVLFVCNAQYCGGGMHVNKGAQLDDGVLGVNLIKKVNLFKTLLSVPRLYSGEFQGLEDFIHIQSAKKIAVFPLKGNRVFIECDGEQPGVLPVEFRLSERKLQVICSSKS